MKQYSELHTMYDDPTGQPGTAPAEIQEDTQEDGAALVNGPEGGE